MSRYCAVADYYTIVLKSKSVEHGALVYGLAISDATKNENAERPSAVRSDRSEDAISDFGVNDSWNS